MIPCFTLPHDEVMYMSHLFDVSFVGGGTLVLEGTGFGASQPAGTTLVIGGEPATITLYTDTRVEATFPAQAAGNHAIKFTVGNNGYAAIS